MILSRGRPVAEAIRSAHQETERTWKAAAGLLLHKGCRQRMGNGMSQIAHAVIARHGMDGRWMDRWCSDAYRASA